MALESLQRVRGKVNLLSIPSKKSIGINIPQFLDLEEVFPFMRVFAIELMTNTTQHFKNYTDFNKACDEYICPTNDTQRSICYLSG
jgi:uncharacterized membrane protein